MSGGGFGAPRKNVAVGEAGGGQPVQWELHIPIDGQIEDGFRQTAGSKRRRNDGRPQYQIQIRFVQAPGSMSAPFLFAVSDNREVIAASVSAGTIAPLIEDTIVNGRISKPGEVDRYHLAVEPGQKWVFEVAAASLGASQLDAILTLYDESGKKIGSGDDGNGIDPVLPFTIPAGVKDLTIAVEDLLGRGGDMYAYRLKAKQQEPDFSVDLATPFVNVSAGGTAAVVAVIQRRGYEGAIRLSMANLPEGFHFAGGHVPPESAAQVFNNDNAGRRTATSTMTITADANAKPQSLDLTVIAEAVTPSGVIRRIARGPGMITAIRGDKQKPFTAPWLDMQLPMATTSALPVTLESPAPLVRLAQGFEYTLEYRVRRKEGARIIGKVTPQAPPGVGNLRIVKGVESKNPDAGSVLLNTNFATPITTFDMIVTAQAEIDGKPVTVVSPAIEIEVVPGYDVRFSKSTIEIEPGGKMEVAGKIHRELTFEGGEIRIAVEDLPDHVQCPTVTVPTAQREFILRCEAESGAKSGAFPIRIASSAPDTGHKAKAEYKIADVEAKLIVGGAARNAAANRREP